MAMKTLFLSGLMVLLHSCLSLCENSQQQYSKRCVETAEEEPSTCIPRDGDCINDRNGCCRSKIFQDRCKCRRINSEGNMACSCKQPPYWMARIEEILGDVPYSPKPDESECVPKHQDCSNRTDCCTGYRMDQRYRIHTEIETCKCYDMLVEDAIVPEICACVSREDEQALAQGFRFVRRLYDIPAERRN